MKRLLDNYRASQTLANAQAIRAYDRKHPMCRCLFAGIDADLIADAIHHANKGSK